MLPRLFLNWIVMLLQISFICLLIFLCIFLFVDVNSSFSILIKFFWFNVNATFFSIKFPLRNDFYYSWDSVKWNSNLSFNVCYKDFLKFLKSNLFCLLSRDSWNILESFLNYEINSFFLKHYMLAYLFFTCFLKFFLSSFRLSTLIPIISFFLSS